MYGVLKIFGRFLKNNMAKEYTKYEVAITAIIVKDGRFLITRRAMTRKRWPGKWTVPGGHLDPSDYESYPKETEDYWYNVLEKALKREVREETGLEIDGIEYVTSLATTHADGAPSLVISCLANWVSGEVVYVDGETDAHAWVDLKEAKNYDLLDGIYDELAMAENRRQGVKTEWGRAEEQL